MISTIIPVYNENDNIQPLFKELGPVLRALGRPYEIIFVNDGSTDGTRDRLQSLQRDAPGLVLPIHLKPRSGQTAAMDAGFKRARGDIFVTLDGDLQNDPADIPRMMDHLNQYDVICGIRKERQDPWIKRLSSHIANRVRNALSREDIQDTGCTLRVYKKQFVQKINLFHGMHRFLPTLLAMEGARIYQMEVNHRERHRGVGKYKFSQRLVKPFIDLLAVCWMKKYHLDYEIE